MSRRMLVTVSTGVITGVDTSLMLRVCQVYNVGEFMCTYRPQRLTIGHPHPDHIVESASLAAAHPPKVWYDCKTLKVRRQDLALVLENAPLHAYGLRCDCCFHGDSICKLL